MTTISKKTKEGKEILQRFAKLTNYQKVSKIEIQNESRWKVYFKTERGIYEEDPNDPEKDILISTVWENQTEVIYWDFKNPNEIEKQKLILTGVCDLLKWEIGGQSYLRIKKGVKI